MQCIICGKKKTCKLARRQWNAHITLTSLFHTRYVMYTRLYKARLRSKNTLWLRLLIWTVAMQRILLVSVWSVYCTLCWNWEIMTKLVCVLENDLLNKTGSTLSLRIDFQCVMVHIQQYRHRFSKHFAINSLVKNDNTPAAPWPGETNSPRFYERANTA